jgi:protoporphyrin/coproporphyrin ferrochelatase
LAEPGTAILCMAYGSPAGEAAIEEYFTHIRGGRPPSPEALAELTSRYRAIGGSPLAEITAHQAAALATRTGIPSYAGYKHAPPFVGEVARQVAASGATRLVGLPLAPHYAAMSLGGYRRALEEAWEGELVFIPGFHDHPAFIAAVVALLEEALAGYRPDRLFFTAHSLPARIITEGDGYQDQLLASCRLVAERLPLPEWEFAFQSASTTGEPWLGPDLLDAAKRSGAKTVLVCPIGFVADHLEILYDLDVEAQAFAREKGIEIRRTASFNDRPIFIDALAEVVMTALGPAPRASRPAADRAG